MKKQLIIACLAVMAVPTLNSCKKGFEDLNVDPINIIETTPDKLLAPAMVNSLWPGMNRNRGFNNELMQVTVSQSDGDNTVFRFAFRANQSDYLWNTWFVQLTNFKQIDSLARTEKVTNTSYQAIGKIGKAWLFSNLTDIYGDIPYFDALKGDQENVMPAFDRQKDIYLDIFNQLEEANTLLAGNAAIVVSSDPMYKGDIAKWRKFSNSLYLRLLMRVSGKTETQQAVVAKIKQIIENPSQYPVFQSNADNARLLWSGGTSTTDPYTSPYVNGVRAQDFRGPAVCSFFLDNLVDWTDPRYVSSTPYGSGAIGRFGISQASGGGWFGVPSGYIPGRGDTKGCYFQSYDNTSTGGTWSLQQNQNTGIIMQYAELQFILAEASLKGWISGDTKTFYYQGIASAINYWVPNFPESTTSTNFTEHLKNLDAGGQVWSDNLSQDAKMEMIHLQKYYALFMTDMQQWFEYRRTGHPVLPKGPGLSNGGRMPARLVYPVYVQAANPTNYKAAVAIQGPDDINTQVWWQRP
jgi:hypothetical protein